MNGHFYFEIQADDTHRAADLYKGVFGWKFEEVYGLSEYEEGYVRGMSAL
jgi:predicted enzyme related to lactoylglutathione lyase